MKKPQKKQIEIEHRAVFDKKEHDRLKRYLRKNAKDLGQDDKDVYFFLLHNKIAKVVNNVSKKNAKIVAKLARLGRGRSDFEEIEVTIDSKDFEKTVSLFSNLNFDDIQRSYQIRRNYIFKGVELALKHTESFGYHLELEIVIDDIANKDKAEDKIRRVAQELGVKILTAEELVDLGEKVDSKYKKGKYKKNK